jgi:hypothetical protein
VADNDLELVACKVSVGSSRFVIMSVYKPPSCNNNLYLQKLSEVVLRAEQDGVTLVICGDVNIDLGTHQGRLLVDNFCHSTRLSQHVNRITHQNATIDHIYSSESATISQVQYFPPVEKHHLLVCVDVKVESNISAHLSTITVQDYHKVDWQMANLFLTDFHLEELMGSASDVDLGWEMLAKCILQAMKQFIPTRQVKVKHWSPWMTKEILTVIRDRDRAFNIWDKVRVPANRKAYQQLRERARKVVYEGKKAYILKTIGTFQYDARFWKHVKHLLGGNSKQKIPDLSAADNSILSTDSEKAGVLAGTFATHWTRQEPVSCTELGVDRHTTVPTDDLCPTAFVLQELRDLKGRKASGPDCISTRFLKGCRYSLAEPITLLINQTLRTGCLPAEWKLGKIIPIFKGGLPQAPGNYRPITLLSVVSKIAEKYIRSRLVPIIDPLLPAQQYGFRPGRDTQGALLRMETAVVSSLEKCREKEVATSVCMVSFDTRKAFDTVSHRRLLLHLRDHFKVPAWLLRWLRDYLMSREVYVSVGNANSIRRHVLSGVPQGSVLGPVLHNAAMWRFDTLKLSPNAHCQMYADDVFYSKPMITNSCAQQLNADCQLIIDLVTSEGQSMNANKTQAVCVSLAPVPCPPPHLHIDGVDIDFADELTYLGVRFDRRLNMRAHINHVTAKARRKLGGLHTVLRKWKMHAQFGRIFQCVIQPIMTYSLFLTHGRTAYGDNKYGHVQRLAARHSLNRYDIGHAELYKLTGWQTVEEIAHVQRLRLAYDYYHMRKPIPPDILSTFTDRRVSTRNRHAKQLYTRLSGHQLKTGNMCGVTMLCSAWNELTTEVVDMTRKQFVIYGKSL